MEKNLKKMKFRQLTKNEIVLLSLLLIVIVSWLGYRFIYTPQIEKINDLAESKIEYQDKIDVMNAILRKENSIDEEWNILHKEKEQIVSQYFPKLDQPQIIYLLNELIEHENLSVTDLNFNRPSTEDIGGFQVRNMDISFPYNGGYNGVIDVLNAIRRSPKKILVDSLSIDKAIAGDLNGNMSLKIYSLEGIAEADEEVIYIDTVTDGEKETPFMAYEEFNDEKLLAQSDENSGLIEDHLIKISLHDFESKSYDFIPSNPLVKGSVSQSSIAKSKKHSLKLEYNILAMEEENRAYIDISKSNIVLKYPADTIGIWVYSYDYSPATLGIGFKGQMGEETLAPLTKGIGWSGWKHIEIVPPSDLSLYPLSLDYLYLEIPKDRDDYGIILFDKLEAIYTKNLDEDGSDNSLGEYIFHVVQNQETISSISKLHYGTINYISEILKLNEMKTGDPLPVGKVLVLKKR